MTCIPISLEGLWDPQILEPFTSVKTISSGRMSALLIRVGVDKMHPESSRTDRLPSVPETNPFSCNIFPTRTSSWRNLESRERGFEFMAASWQLATALQLRPVGVSVRTPLGLRTTHCRFRSTVKRAAQQYVNMSAKATPPAKAWHSLPARCETNRFYCDITTLWLG